MEEIVESKAVCPKCKSKDLILEEYWVGHFIQWEQLNGRFDRKDGSLEPGDPNHVNGKCKKCLHTWRFRGIHQIDELIP